MKERPILMSEPMVRAILAGLKTQTRRVIKDQPPSHCSYLVRPEAGDYSDGIPRWASSDGATSDYSWHPWIDDEPAWQTCPYGKPGDRLWVREAWTSGYQDGSWGTIFRTDKTFLQGKRAHPKGPHYHAKQIDEHIEWRLSIYMPRWASRITLEITEVRVQRLQEISEDDAIAEGIEVSVGEISGEPVYRDYSLLDAQDVLFDRRPLRSYRTLWESINGAGSWDANPCVWAITFKVV